MIEPRIYTLGGTVQAGAGVYIERQADSELLHLCRQHQFAYLLAARQVGKSSLMIRTAQRLTEHGFHSVIVDATMFGTQTTDEAWYLGFLYVIKRQLRLVVDVTAFWAEQAAIAPNQRFARFVEDVLSAEGTEPVVIFVDEIDTTLTLSFRDDFFATIRYLYNARAMTPALQRLSFVLIGVASPSDLINDPKRTPFNIGHRVDLTDFNFAEASILSKGFGLPPAQAAQTLRWILDWTGGHPYLTQRLCAAAVEQQPVPSTSQAIDEIVGSVFLGEMSERDNNLQFVRDMLTERAPDRQAVLSAYRRVHASRRPIRDEQQSLVFSHLKLSGIVYADDAGHLRVRNRIYREVFDKRWIRNHRPDNWWSAIPPYVKYTAAAIMLLAVSLLISLLFAVGQYRHAREAEVIAQKNQRMAEERAAESHAAQAAAEAARREVSAYTQRLLARQLADDALQNAETVDLSLLLSIEASHRAANAETINSLRSALENNPHRIRALRSHSAPLRSVALHPRGNIIASGGHDNQITFWNSRTGLPSGESITGFDDIVVSLAFSPDGETLASGIGDGSIHFWNATNRQPTGTPLRGHTSWVHGLAYSPDGRVLASASADRTIRLWNTAAGQLIADPIAVHEDEVTDLVFSPDGGLLASASRDQRIRLWEATTGEPIGDALEGHTDWVSKLAFSPDGAVLASAGYDGQIRFWDVTSGQLLGEPLFGHTGSITSLAFGPGARLLASGGDDRTILLWDVETRRPIGKPLRGHMAVVSDIAFFADGQSLASAGEDGAVMLWDIRPRHGVSQRLSEHVDGVTSVALNHDGSLLASGSTAGDVILWDMQAGPTPIRRFSGHSGEIETVAFSPDGITAASAGSDAEVLLWDTTTGEQLCPPLTGHKDTIESVAFSPDGAMLASGSVDHVVRLWNPATCRPIGEPLTAHADGVESIAFSPDGRMLASASWDGSIILWDPATGLPLGDPLTGHTSWVHSVAFSPDSRILASASADGTIRLWDPATGQATIAPVEGHGTEVNSVAFSPDGKTLVSGGRDNTVRLWEVTTGEPTSPPFDAEADWVWSVTYHPDGDHVVSGHRDGTVMIWNTDLTSWQALACRKAGRNLTKVEWERFLGTETPYRETCPSPVFMISE